jgi:hypothetical protein
MAGLVYVKTKTNIPKNVAMAIYGHKASVTLHNPNKSI